MQDEIFSKRYREQRARLLETTTNLLRSKLVEAVQVLVDLYSDNSAPPAVGATCARSVIALGFASEMAELEEPLAQLETVSLLMRSSAS